jgi:hypothetical protein
MDFPEKVRVRRPGRTVLGAAIAGWGTCALCLYGWWSVRSSGPLSDVIVWILLLIPVAIGATAGLVSGRFRGAPASWAAAVIGWWLAYQVNYTIFPGWPTSDSGFAGDVLYAAIFLLPLIAGGHLLGTWVANNAPRRAEGHG